MVAGKRGAYVLYRRVELHDKFPVPRSARLPIEVRPPEGFDPANPATWPPADGRLEFVDGRLLFVPPCGEQQALVVPQIAHILIEWRDAHPGFDVASNEAGMCLGGDVRGADVAVWSHPAPGRARQTGFRTTPPILAVEVAGQDEPDVESALREKARWYLRNGVKTVWIALPDRREVAVLREGLELLCRSGERVPEQPELPGLAPEVDRFFATL